MTIHWWHTKRLAQELANDSVSEDQSLWYAVISALIYLEGLYYATWFGGYHSWLLLAEFVAVCLIAIIGLRECYKANGGPNGKHFLKRLYCLGVPIGLKLAIASTLVGQIVYFGFPHVVTHETFRNPDFVWQLLSFSLAGLFAVIYFWCIAYYMGLIVTAERSNPLMQPTGRERPAAD